MILSQVMWTFLFSALLTVVVASTDVTFGVSSNAKLPAWLTIHKDREKMSQYMELARQRHSEAVQKARDSYFHGSAAEGESFSLDSLEFDEYEVKASGSIPDFVSELERKCFVTWVFFRLTSSYPITSVSAASVVMTS